MTKLKQLTKAIQKANSRTNYQNTMLKLSIPSAQIQLANNFYDSLIKKDEMPKEKYFVSHKNSAISSTATDLLLYKYYCNGNHPIN